MNIEYEIQTSNLDEDFFRRKNEQTDFRNFMIKMKEDLYTEAISEYKDIDLLIKDLKKEGYNSFDEYFNAEFLKGMDIDEFTEYSIEKNVQDYKDETLNNILIKLYSTNDENAQNIIFSAHYDCAEESYGAGDDGICVSGLLETIRCLKDKEYNNNNIFILFTDGEEDGYYGAYEFYDKNKINVDLIINFDNCGNVGKPILYRYTNDNLAKQYFKSVSNEVSYSLFNNTLFNTNSKFFRGDCSDFDAFSVCGYNSLDLAIIGNPKIYHNENDNFYNTDITTLKTLTKSMINMVNYYGNNNVELSNKQYVNFKLSSGFEFSLPKSLYIIVSGISLCIGFIYIILLFERKRKVILKIVSILLFLISLLSLIILKNLSLLCSIPLIILCIAEIIENKKIKFTFKLVSFEIYLFVIIQAFYYLLQYLIWSL